MPIWLIGSRARGKTKGHRSRLGALPGSAPLSLHFVKEAAPGSPTEASEGPLGFEVVQITVVRVSSPGSSIDSGGSGRLLRPTKMSYSE
jgi:hypothetical protein